MKERLKISFNYKRLHFRELLLVLYILSGSIKSVFIYYDWNSKVDITLLFGTFLIADIILVKTKIEKSQIQRNAILVLFFLYLVISLIWSISSEYKYVKIFLFTTNIIAFFYTSVRLNRLNVHVFWKFFIFLSTIISIWFSSLLIGYIDGTNYAKVKPILALYLSHSFYCGISIICLVYIKNLFARTSVIRFILLLINLILIVSLGGRAPLLFLVFSIILLIVMDLIRGEKKPKLLSVKIKKSHFFTISIILTGFVLVLLQFRETAIILVSRTLSRLELIFVRIVTGKSDETMTSSNERIEHIEYSINLIFDNFTNFIFGYGFGSYGLMKNGIDGRSYPHNILIEIFFEAGLLGLILFLLFLIFNIRNRLNLFSLGILIFIFLNYFKSNSIIDLRLLFAVLPILYYFRNE